MSPTARIERDNAWPEISFEERIGTAEFRIHEKAHITVNGDSCRGCTTRECVVACPANLFVPTSDGGILFNYENCLNAEPAISCATKKAPSAGPIPKAATASSSIAPDSRP